MLSSPSDGRLAAFSPTSREPDDALELLQADHEDVSLLFEQYLQARSFLVRKELVAEICTALVVHAQIEEEIFYPALKDALDDRSLVTRANVQHACLDDLIARLRAPEPDEAVFDARVRVLAEYVKHHVKEEQNVLFRLARASSLDLFELGDRLAARKEDLLSRGRAHDASGTRAAAHSWP